MNETGPLTVTFTPAEIAKTGTLPQALEFTYQSSHVAIRGFPHKKTLFHTYTSLHAFWGCFIIRILDGGISFSHFRVLNKCYGPYVKKQWLSHNKKIYISKDICVSGYPNKINWCAHWCDWLKPALSGKEGNSGADAKYLVSSEEGQTSIQWEGEGEGVI